MSDKPNADSAPCGLCGSPAVGFATIDGVRYCHQDESPTCYERAQWQEPPTSRYLVDLWEQIDGSEDQ